MLAATFGNPPSVDAPGQPDVRDEHVRDQPPAPCQRLLAISRVDARSISANRGAVFCLSEKDQFENADGRVKGRRSGLQTISASRGIKGGARRLYEQS
jgi:hypothetical protein